MSNRLKKSGKKTFRTTFTYFIPAPPRRKTGYREVEIDKIMQGIFQSGFEIESFHVEATGGEHGGLFIVALLKTTSKKVFEQDLKQDLHEKFRLAHTHSSPDIILDEDDNA